MSNNNSSNNTVTTETTLKLERETCSRCNGSGSYSYCQRFGSTCFKCAGKKEVYTKRGQAAANYLKTLRSIKIEDVQVGDTVKVGGCTMGGDPYSFWGKVTSTGEGTVSHVVYTNGGEKTTVPLLSFHAVNTKMGESGLQAPAGTLVEKLWTRDEQIAQLKQAIAYQETLTKSGTPRKSRGV
jgi:hypothetical protein